MRRIPGKSRVCFAQNLILSDRSDSSAAMGDAPIRMARDAILEAILEIRFEAREIGEVVVGKLASNPIFSGFAAQRLPIANIPTEAREADETLRFQPLLQLVRPRPGEIVKIGPHAISLHFLEPYPGWAEVFPRIETVCQSLFGSLAGLSVVRVGLRYVNAVTPEHGITRLSDLQFGVQMAGEEIASEMILSHRFRPSGDLAGTMSIATPSFVDGGNLPPECAAFVDIDMFTPKALGEVDMGSVLSWVEKAHDAEKAAFFGLFSDQQLDKLRAE